MPSTVSSPLTLIPLSYAQAVKRLSFSHVSFDEKITICRALLSSNYYPEPCTSVLHFLCSSISKDSPTLEECYTVQATASIVQEQSAQLWRLVTEALLQCTRKSHGRYSHNESPLIADGVIIQGGLHLLAGSTNLKKSVSKALYIIIKNARYTKDIDVHTWLFCAVARAEGPRSLFGPLRSALISHFSRLFSHDPDRGRVAAAAASIISHAAHSQLILEVESLLVHAIRASVPSFYRRFGQWVLLSEKALPQAIHFLLRAYAKHPFKHIELNPSGKRTLWEPEDREAVDFFETLSKKILDVLRVDKDPSTCKDKAFRSRMEAVRVLYMTGSENAAYLSVPRFGESEAKKMRNTLKCHRESTKYSSGACEILKQVLDTAELAQSEGRLGNERLHLTLQAIIAIAEYSFVTVDGFLSEIMDLFFAKPSQREAINVSSHMREFFCALVKRYERSRKLSRLISHLMRDSRLLQSLMPILKHRYVQSVLASIFGRLRLAEGQACVRALVAKSLISSKGIHGLTLISSLFLETVSEPLVQAAVDTIANNVVDTILENTTASEGRECRTHLLSSFLISKTASKLLCTQHNVRIGMFRLARPSSREYAASSEKKLESAVLESLCAEELSTTAELCSNLRCLIALTHFLFRQQSCRDDKKCTSQAIHMALDQFRMLKNRIEKPDLSAMQKPGRKTLYDSTSLEAVLPWIASIGHVLREFMVTDMDNAVIEPFFNHSFLLIPSSHPFWRELSEDTRCAPSLLKASGIALKDLSKNDECAKKIRSCRVSLVLKTVSVLALPMRRRPVQQDLLDLLFAYIRTPCCPESRQHALKAFKSLGNASRFRTTLLTACSNGPHCDLLETNANLPATPSTQNTFSPNKNITAVMLVLTSLTPEQLRLVVNSEVASLLIPRIFGMRAAFEARLKRTVYSTAELFETTGILIDLHASFNSARAIDMGNEDVLMLEKTTAEYIKIVLPDCVNMLSKESENVSNWGEAATEMLSAMLRSLLTKKRDIFLKDTSDTLRTDLILVCSSYLLHPRDELRKMATLLLSKLPFLGDAIPQTLCEHILSLVDSFFERIRINLGSVVKSESQSTGTMKRNLLVVTRLVTCCYHSVCTIPLGASGSNRRDMYLLPGSEAQSDMRFVSVMKIMSHLEAFVRIWSLAIQEMLGKHLSRFRTCEYLSICDSLVCSSLKICLDIMRSDRSWGRTGTEKILLITKQMVESVCSGEKFLESEGTVLLIALQICRTAAKRHTALVSTTAQVIGLLLRRGLMVDDEAVLVAVREATEEVCLSKRWEILSALLADCSTALSEPNSVDSRREVERVAAALFKAVGEPKAQQVLVSLRDSGKESLTHVWQRYADGLLYSGN